MPQTKEIAKLKKQLTELEQEAGENLNGWKRAQADYQNLVKETDKQRSQTIKFANEQFVQQLLPLVDYFEYAFREVPEDQKDTPWMTGIRHIYDQLMKFFEEQGVQKIDTTNQTFDPEFHESVEEVESTDVESGQIIEQTQSGFTMHGTCIRPAKVKIAT